MWEAAEREFYPVPGGHPLPQVMRTLFIVLNIGRSPLKEAFESLRNDCGLYLLLE